jgi:hypothetical protein
MDRYEDTGAAEQALTWPTDILRFYVWSETACRVRHAKCRNIDQCPARSSEYPGASRSSYTGSTATAT